MKNTIITTVTAILFSAALHAESSITLTGVHNCCKKCDNGIVGAISKAGATAKVEKTKVTITAADEATAKKAAAALGAAGYFGAGMEPAAGLSEAKSKSVIVEGAHLCCQKCVDAFNKAAMGAAGVTKTNATKGAASVIVEGDISPKDLIAALNKCGFNGTVK